MPLRTNVSGKPFFMASLFVLGLACFWPAYAVSPTVHRTLGAGVQRPSARSIAQRGVRQQAAPAVAVTTPALRTTSRSAPAVPSSITIASAGIHAEVVPLGLLEGGKLDAPKDGEDTGWYRLGPKPGDVGNAVIDGHLDTSAGPGAFWNLKHVRAGDLVKVTDERGVIRTFKVRKTAVYDVDKAPMLEIFGKADGRHLNLITCAGVWRESMNHYDKRLIVFTDLVAESSAHTTRR